MVLILRGINMAKPNHVTKFPQNHENGEANGLLGLYAQLEIRCFKLANKSKKGRLFCKKYQKWLTAKLIESKHCFRAKNIYYHKKLQKKVIVFCPNLFIMELNGQPPKAFYLDKTYQNLYHDEEVVYLIESIFIHKQPTETKIERSTEKDVFSKTTEAIHRIKEAYHELQREG